jgi:signal transduction histidine kinase
MTMHLIRWPSLHEVSELVRETVPSPAQMALRLRTVERDIVLPVKAVAIGIMSYSLYHTRWFQDLMLARSVAHEMIERFFLIYLILSVLMAGVLVFGQRLPARLMQRLIFTSSFVDGLFLTALIFVTGGFDSTLYWLFLGLIARNAMSVPLATPQLLLNFILSICYLSAGILDLAVPEELFNSEDLPRAGYPAESFLLRLFVLWLVSLCCYGVQLLFEKQRLAWEEARESYARQQQLSSAGRLAAKIAHELKNPLGIMNNAIFSIQRALQQGKPVNTQQVQIIREEIERADSTITKLMGYAQLAEGKVDKLNVTEALDRAVAEVFPAAAKYEITIHRDYAPHLPPLLMQRMHLSEILVNLLLNAREAMPGRGDLHLKAVGLSDDLMVVSVRDSGPGIKPEHLEQIFDPYFSTKEKGTGLGLAIIKHDIELYGGTVRVESVLGKGATFILHLPIRTFFKAQS